MSSILFDKITAAATSVPFTVDGYKSVGLKCSGVAGAEVINLKVQCGDEWQNVLDSAGAAVTFTSTNKPITIEGSGQYQLVKPVTASAVTIQAD
jgi:hypothetical protein